MVFLVVYFINEPSIRNFNYLNFLLLSFLVSIITSILKIKYMIESKYKHTLIMSIVYLLPIGIFLYWTYKFATIVY